MKENKNPLEINREYSERCIQKINQYSSLPPFLKDYSHKKITIVDLGCGGGQLIFTLKRENPGSEIIGIDISPKRINNLKIKFPKDAFFCQDVCETKLKKNCCDLVCCTQVIEHLEEDVKLIEEINRILKKKGFAFITSVIKEPWAVYKYINRHKQFVLDPTHEREYKNQKDFNMMFMNKFEIIKSRTYPVYRHFLSLKIKIPGYYIIESLFQKK